MAREPNPRHKPIDPGPEGERSQGARAGLKKGRNILKLPMDKMRGFEHRNVLWFPGARFQGRTFDVILIPKDGLAEINFDDD